MVDRKTGRLFWRAARRIHDALITLRSDLPGDLLPRAAVQRLDAIVRRLQFAHDHRWSRGLAEHTRDYDRECRSLIEHLRHRQQALREFLQQRPLLPVHEIWRDLLALGEEFPEVECDLKKGTLTVVTEDIVLEGADLGSFQIVLRWDSLKSDPSYLVINPDSELLYSDITHPHVQNQQLCEGEGSGPISQALEQGRLLDFFVLVRQVLETYNPDSAYRKLSHWRGRDCQDCGCSVSDDESSHCDACGNELCGDCRYGCQHCSNDCCSQCHAVCAHCLGIFCSNCLETCTSCSREFCESCQESPTCCQSCYDKEHPSHASTETEEETPSQSFTADPAVHPVCLGETPVPA